MNKLIQGINKKGYIYQVIDDTTIEVGFMNFVTQFHITHSNKIMITLFDNEGIVIDMKVYQKVGFAIRMMMKYREQQMQKEIEEILNK
jgi:hypothetical protein